MTDDRFPIIPGPHVGPQDFGDLAPMADVPDSSGPGLYVFWSADTFDPPTYVVRGESWPGAYEWFVAYLIDRGLLEDMTDELTADELAALERGESVAGCDYVDGYPGLYYVENIGGRVIVPTVKD